MSDITVITSITGGKDHLLEGQIKGDAKFVAYVDPVQESTDWEVHQAYNKFSSSRRNSRIYKILAHQFVKTKYSIWVDGNIRLILPPEELVRVYLKDHDFAVFKHPSRDCLYEEAIVCAGARLDDPKIIGEQVKEYSANGFAEHKGLAECGILMRRHTPKVEEFNNAWWSEYCRWSVRDQISFPYAADKVGLRVNYINEMFIVRDGILMRGTVAEMGDHLTPRPE